MFKYTQRSFNGGVLDKELMGRQDLAKYFCGASILKNFLVRRQGNISKRRGTDHVADITHILGYKIDSDTGAHIDRTIGMTRTIALVHERDNGFYTLMTGRMAFIVDRDKGVYCNDGVWRKDIPNYHYSGIKSFPHDAECVLDGNYYATLKEAVRKSYAGSTITLRKNIDVFSALPICRGKIDLNGHTITVKEAGVAFVFGNESSTAECGLVDLTHPNTGYNIVWDNGITAATNTVFITHTIGGRMRLDGIRASCPFTGANACFIRDTANAVGSSSYTDCNITCAGGLGFVKVEGNKTTGAGTISISECDITYTHASGKAINNIVSTANRREVTFDKSMLVATKYASTCGFIVNGGIVKHGANFFGSVSGSDATILSRFVAGLVLNGTTTVQEAKYIQSGSTSKGTSTVDGVTYGNYNLTESGAYEYTRTPATPSTPTVYPDIPSNSDPYCIEVPYEDGDLKTIDVFQSGDTLFLAHKYYPPSKIIFNRNAMTLSFENIEFNATTWKRPVITSCVAKINLAKDENSVSGTTTYKTEVSYSVSSASATKTTSVYKIDSGTSTLQTSSTAILAPRTIKYAITYVKDGIESVPSNPVEVTYGAPWESGGKVTINLSKGENETEPDYYNIYKKESTEFGLIGSTTRPYSTDLFPELSGWFDSPYGTEADETFDVESIDTALFNGVPLQATDTLDILNNEVSNAITDTPSRVVGSFGEYNVYRGVGGCHFGDRGQAVFDFGANSAVSANEIKVCFDSHTIRYVENPTSGKIDVFNDMKLSGKRVQATIYYTNKTGTQTEESQTVTQTLSQVTYKDIDGVEHSAYSGDVTDYCGAVEKDSPFADFDSVVNRSIRTATFSFTNLDGGDKQVTKLVLKCVDDIDDGSGTAVETIVDSYVSGIVFTTNDGHETAFEDDYITPDLTVTPPSCESAFRGRGNYPSCVGMYQQRLIYGATDDQPFGFWMSAIGDLYNFSPHSSVREDDTIKAELAATEFPNINHIIVNRDIIMLGDGGEWKIAPVSGNTITYKTVSATLQSSIGSAKWIKPITVGEEVVFAERTGMTLRSIVYNYASDGYQSTDLCVLSSDIFKNNPIVRMCYKQHPDSTIECVLQDGTIAAMVYMTEHEVAAWSMCVLGGSFKATDIASSKALNGNTTDVLMTVTDGSSHLLWSVRPDLPDMTVSAQTCMDGIRILSSVDAENEWKAGWTAIDTLSGRMIVRVEDVEPSREYLCGYAFDAEIATVRPEPTGQGTIQFEIKNAKDVEIRCLNGSAWKVAPYGMIDNGVYAQKHDFTVSATNGAISLDTGDHTVLLSGNNCGDGRIHLKSSTPFPLSILSVSINYEIQPMSNQEG